MINEIKLKQLRTNQKMTQIELARELKISVEEIGLLERKTDKLHNPHLKIVISIANYFDKSIDWLCDRDNIQYLSRFEKKLVQALRSDKINKNALEKAIDIYDTELGKIQDKIHCLVPYMDLETAQAAYKLLTSMVTTM